MSYRELHQQNIARIENHITKLEARILELQERISRREATSRNAEISRVLFAILIDHLEVMKIREQQALDDAQANRIIGNSDLDRNFESDIF
jgi:hypothetical protein